MHLRNIVGNYLTPSLKGLSLKLCNLVSQIAENYTPTQFFSKYFQNTFAKFGPNISDLCDLDLKMLFSGLNFDGSWFWSMSNFVNLFTLDWSNKWFEK